MKKLYTIFLLVFSLLNPLLAVSSEKKTTLKIAFGANKPPFMFELGTNTGLEYDIIKESFALNGYSIEPLQLTYHKLATALKDDKTIDGAAGVQKNSNDPFFYSDNYIVFNNFAYTKRSDNITLNSFNDLKGKNIAIWGDGHKHLGTDFFNLFNPDSRLTHTPNFYEINNQKEQVASLFNGIANVVIIDKKIFYWQKNVLSNEINTEIDIVEHKLFEDATGFNVTFRDKKINDIFNKGLEELHLTGRYQKILDNYADKNYQFFVQYLDTISTLIKPLIIEDDIDAINTIIHKASKQIPSIRCVTVKDRFNKVISVYLNDEFLNTSFNRIQHTFYQDHLTSNTNTSIGNITITYFNKQSKQSMPDITSLIQNADNLNNFQKTNLLNSLNILNNHLNKTNQIQFTQKEQEWIKNHPVINYVIDPNWSPFEFFDEQGNHIGITSEFLNIVKEKTGITFKINPTKSWKEAVEKIANKESDMLTLLKETEKRKETLYFSVPYVSYPFVIVSRNDQKFIFNTSYLKGKKVAVVDKYSITEHLQRDYPTIDFVFVNSIYEALLKVSNNEAYAYVDILPAIGHNITKAGFTNLKIIGDTEYKLPLSFALRKELGQTGIDVITKVFNSISYEEKTKILQKWINIDIQPKTDYMLALKIAIILIILLFIIILWNRKLANEIKKRKLAQRELLEFKNGLFVNSKAIMLLINPKTGEIVDCNKSALNYYGYEYNELKDIPIYEINQLTNEEIQKEMKKASLQKREHFYFKHKLKNGEIKDVEVDSGPIVINGQNLLYSIIHDITEQKRQEKIINEQSKLASMGEMIANIAHQWRQPLSIISTSAGGAKIEKELGQLEDKSFYQFMDNIIDQTEYLSDTIDDFRNFIKNDRKEVKFNINDIIDKFKHLMIGSFKTHDIHLITNIEDNIQLLGYPNELIQCIINIYNNSKDAFTNSTDTKYLFIDIKSTQNTIIINFKDNAGGIPKEILPRVFEPYFTTKHQFKGTGLGLSMTYKIIVEGMNGDISANNTTFEYNNTTYKGAEFTIVLPLQEKK